ncbi:MAG: AAA family ATPase [Clostridia bacterium]|nr:AAA family ATPase [Clostridia bacterium]
MRLNRLHLENFRNFPTLDIDFDEHLTVIVGNNGAGKTTILEAVSIAIGTFFAGLDGIAGKTVNKKDAHIDSYEVGTSDDIQVQFPVVVKASGTIGKKTVVWERSLLSSTGRTTIVEAKELTKCAEKYQKRLRAGDDTLILPLIAYYGTGRLWDYHREKATDAFKVNTRTNGYINSLDGTANIKLMMNWFKKKTIQKYQRQEANQGDLPELNIVYRAMEACFQAVTGYDKVKIQYNLNRNELDVSYSDKNGGNMRIPLNSLSDGYKGTISLIADIAYRMAVLNPQLLEDVLVETTGIVLIDEADLHLHPIWQQRILSDLSSIFPRVQFIVTTHAPAVINSVDSKNLIILENNEVYSPNGQIYGKDANSVLLGVMGANERPSPIKEQFVAFYTAIDNQHFDEATQILKKLEDEIGNDDVELAACRVKLQLARFKGGF